jgi:hypothetical protein
MSICGTPLCEFGTENASKAGAVIGPSRNERDVVMGTFPSADERRAVVGTQRGVARSLSTEAAHLAPDLGRRRPNDGLAGLSVCQYQ